MEVSRDEPSSNNLQQPTKSGFFTKLSDTLLLYQLKALFLKNLTLQKRQIGTVMCHILAPILILTILNVLVSNLRTLIDLNKSDFLRRPLIPIVHNLPMGLVKNSTVFPISVHKCTKWFGVNYADKSFVDQQLVQRFLQDPMREYCNDTGGLVPDFKDFGGKNINRFIADTIDKHNSLPLLPGRDIQDVEAFPDGTISFQQVNDGAVNARLQINDLFLAEYHIPNGVTKVVYKLSDFQQKKSNELNPFRKRLEDSTASWPVLTSTEGLMGLMDNLARATLSTLSKNTFLLSGYANIISNDYTEKFVEGIYFLIGSTMFPSAVGMVLPLFMYLTVLEKHSRVKQGMQMHGLREVHYWISNVVTNYLFFLCIYFSFYLVGRYFYEMAVFTKTPAYIMHAINMVWGCNLIGVGMILQLFISSPRTANILGHTLAASLSFYSIATSLILYANPLEVPKMNLLLPQMSFIRIYYHISKQCMETGCFQSLTQFSGELQSAWNYFIFTGFAYPAIAIGINICWSYNIGTNLCPNKSQTALYQSSTVSDRDISSPEKPVAFEAGSCVAAEETRVREECVNQQKECPLVCYGLTKRYTRAGTSFVALHPTYLSVSKGEVLGLLGPNGAGKTTLISILTGLVKPDSGKAWIGGASILNELPKVYKSIGVCPQFDLFWEDLTVEEHLLFYLRLKGSKHDLPSEEEEEVLRVCTDVELREHRHKLAKALSGGMKRRLSLAIALIGNPDAIFLDEPTTGLDPLNREIFWGILQRIKKDKSIILTTHLMQEADYLSDRIAIIHKGKLMCIGTPTEIKRNYGSGLILNLIFDRHAGFNEESRPAVIEGLRDMFDYLCKEGILKSYRLRGDSDQKSPSVMSPSRPKQPNESLPAASLRTAQFEVEVDDEHVLDLFDYLEQNKGEFMVGHYELAQSPLKDVFEKIVLSDS